MHCRHDIACPAWGGIARRRNYRIEVDNENKEHIEHVRCQLMRTLDFELTVLI